jgi:hypothetical protein
MAYENHDIIWSGFGLVSFGFDRIWTLQMLLHIQFYPTQYVLVYYTHLCIPISSGVRKAAGLHK